ncbi:MAG: hypothetical protein JW893_06250, partial [Candidatus Omnitrophica bacterium]|nr:hypothetical protein [Candidatus Omnitrophota bacterium]
MKQPLKRISTSIFVTAFLISLMGIRSAWAVVGMAEGLDEFQRIDLEVFQDNLIHEEKREQLDEADNLAATLKKKEKELGELDESDRDFLTLEVEYLRQQLLELPKRDRFRVEANGTYVYDSNIARRQLRSEKGDSLFTSNGTGVIDLSGKKTDFEYEISGGKQWNIVYSEQDDWQIENRLRYRRKMFTKIEHSWQGAVRKHNSKTIEIDNNKVRWDFSTASAWNYRFSPKLSLNADYSVNKRLFRQEAFDQDS